LIFVALIFMGLVAFLFSPSHHASKNESPSQSETTADQHATLISKEEGIRLTIASHGRLFYYFPQTNETKVLHEGDGVHYGTFPGDKDNHGSLKSLWVVVRPHNWHPTTSDEVLIELDATTGSELQRKKIPSRFTHDVVRSGDSVWVCNTDEGKVLQLRYPSMELVRTLGLFTKKDHVNTLAPLRPGKLFAILHNKGLSDLALIDLSANTQTPLQTRIKGVGTSSHGLVEYRGGWLVLDSERSSLVWIKDTQGLLTDDSLGSGAQEGKFNGKKKQGRRMIHDIVNVAEELDAESQHLSSPNLASKPLSNEAVRYVLWTAPEGGKFLKGLCVINDVAYFGISVFSPRNIRQDPSADSELGAFDLLQFQLISRVTVPTHGLLNVISAPHLGEKSTYQASTTLALQGTETDVSWRDSLGRHSLNKDKDDISPASLDAYKQVDSSSSSRLQGIHRDHLLNNTAVFEASRKLKEMGYEPKIGGKWPTGLPYLELSTKGSLESWKAGLQLPLRMINVSHLQDLVENCPAEMWEPEVQRKQNVVIDGRKSNTDKYKPGVKAMYLMFSDRSTVNVFRFPYYEVFKAAIIPMLHEIIGPSEMDKIVRMQLALMPPSTTIKAHRDMGGYALKGHRIHIPVTTNPEVSFQVCPVLEERSRAMNGKEVRDEMIEEGDCLAIPMSPGMVFEVNNRVLHRVENKGTSGRVTLVVDVAEDTRYPKGLMPGAACNYVQSNMVCDKDKIID
jgi:hypothetical protein